MTKKIAMRILLIASLSVLVFAGGSSAYGLQSSGTGKIIGRVVDRATNSPLAAELGLSISETGDIALKHTNASEAGDFVIDGLPAGQMHLTTKLDGYAAEHQSITLNASETKTVTFTLARFKLVRGVVLSPLGTPLTGADVRVIYPVENLARGAIHASYQWESGDAKTDALGNFIIDVHPDKPFVLEASQPGYLSAFSAPIRIPLTLTTLASTPVETVVNLRLVTGVSVIGDIKDANGNAVQNAQIRLLEPGAGRNLQGFVSHDLLKQRTRFMASASDGTFRFDGVNVAKKLLIVTRPGYVPLKRVVDLTQGQVPVRVVLIRQ